VGLRDALLSAIGATELHRCTPYGVQPRNLAAAASDADAMGVQGRVGRRGAGVAAAYVPDVHVRSRIAVASSRDVAPPIGPVQIPDRRWQIEARLLRWGWDARDAAEVAARLDGRDSLDDRVACVECSHYRAPRRECQNHRRAGLVTAGVGRDLAGLPQRCPGYEEPGT